MYYEIYLILLSSYSHKNAYQTTFLCVTINHVEVSRKDCRMSDVAVLMSEIGEIESEIKMLEIKKQSLREQIIAHMKSLNLSKLQVDHIGVAVITAGKTSVKYDADGLDSLCAQLLRDGDVGTANAIANLREEKMSAGYLMIKREK